MRCMGFAKAKFKVVGDKGSLEGTAIADTGSLMSVIDEILVDKLGLKYTGRALELTTLSGEEITSNEALINAFEVEGERLVSERVAICKLPNNVKEKLRAMGAHEQVIIGVITLEAAGLTVNPLKGRLEKVGWLTL